MKKEDQELMAFLALGFAGAAVMILFEVLGPFRWSFGKLDRAVVPFLATLALAVGIVLTRTARKHPFTWNATALMLVLVGLGVGYGAWAYGVGPDCAGPPWRASYHQDGLYLSLPEPTANSTFTFMDRPRDDGNPLDHAGLEARYGTDATWSSVQWKPPDTRSWKNVRIDLYAYSESSASVSTRFHGDGSDADARRFTRMFLENVTTANATTVDAWVGQVMNSPSEGGTYTHRARLQVNTTIRPLVTTLGGPTHVDPVGTTYPLFVLAGGDGWEINIRTSQRIVQGTVDGTLMELVVGSSDFAWLHIEQGHPPTTDEAERFAARMYAALGMDLGEPNVMSVVSGTVC